MTAIMNYSDIKPNVILRGPLFPEPVQVITVIPMGDAIKLIGKGLNTGKLHDPILSQEQLATLRHKSAACPGEDEGRRQA